MENLEHYTPTELLKLLNDLKSNHDIIKSETYNYTNEVDILDLKINYNLSILTELEKDYIKIVEEINNR